MPMRILERWEYAREGHACRVTSVQLHNGSIKSSLSFGFMAASKATCYTEKIIKEEQLQLKKYIEENYSKIRDVERELKNLTMEMKLTAGPKKAALEFLRKKIEASTERIRVAKLKEEQAGKVCHCIYSRFILLCSLSIRWCY